jgi:hypothetical protein
MSVLLALTLGHCLLAGMCLWRMDAPRPVRHRWATLAVTSNILAVVVMACLGPWTCAVLLAGGLAGELWTWQRTRRPTPA